MYNIDELPVNDVAEDLPDRGAAPGGRRERKLRSTIDHIGAVAWDMFEAHGFEDVTMESIALAADVAKGTLYKHFPVKEALIAHRFDKDRSEQAPRIRKQVLAKATCAERLELRLQKEAAYIESRRAFVPAYLRYTLDGDKLARRKAISGPLEVLLLEVITAGQATGEVVADVAAERLVEYLSSLRLAVLMRWLRTPDASLNAMNREMLRIFLLGATCTTYVRPQRGA